MAHAENAAQPAFGPSASASDGLAPLIPYRNSKALAAYYLGVFSVIPVLGAICGPAALILGTQGYQYAKERPEARGKVHAVVGIVLGALSTLLNWGMVLVIFLALLVTALKAR